MTYKVVMAIDPGGTSGVAFRFPNGSILTTACKTPEELYDLVVQPNIEQIVIERFAAQKIDYWGLYTVDLVGGVKAICHINKIPLKIHQPQDRYPFKKEARELLKGRSVVIHEIEALEHLLRFEYDNNIGEGT